VTGSPSIASKSPSKSDCWKGEQPVEGGAAGLLVLGEDHFLHDG
jgi:hypothetical protein